MHGNIYTVIQQRHVEAAGKNVLHAYFIEWRFEIDIPFAFNAASVGVIFSPIFRRSSSDLYIGTITTWIGASFGGCRPSEP